MFEDKTKWDLKPTLTNKNIQLHVAQSCFRYFVYIASLREFIVFTSVYVFHLY